MSRIVGAVRSSLPGNAGLGAPEILALAASNGVGGVLFNSMAEISPRLDAGEVGEAKREADRLGLGLSVNLGHVNPALPVRGEPLIAAGGGDVAAGARRIGLLAAKAGIRDVMFTIGRIEDRFDASVAWQDQLDGVAALVAAIGPEMRAHGACLILKTHEEISSLEVLRLVETAGAGNLAVALDPVNFPCRIEDPVAATRRLAAHVAQVHYDDATLRMDGDMMRRHLAPVGEGMIDWAAILAMLPDANVWIELHSGQFAMPVFDRAWLDAQPEIALPEYAGVIGAAVRAGEAPVPWDQTAPTARFAHASKTLKAALR